MIRLDFVSNSSVTTAIFPTPLTEEEMKDPVKVEEYNRSLYFASAINAMITQHKSNVAIENSVKQHPWC